MLKREEIKEKYRNPKLTGALNAMFDEVVDYVIDNYDKTNLAEIKNRYHSPDQPGIMHAMFDEVVDFVVNNYDFNEGSL